MNEAEATVARWMILENLVTLGATLALIVGAMALGAGGYSWWGLLLMLNLNTVKLRKD